MGYALAVVLRGALREERYFFALRQHFDRFSGKRGPAWSLQDYHPVRLPVGSELHLDEIDSGRNRATV